MRGCAKARDSRNIIRPITQSAGGIQTAHNVQCACGCATSPTCRDPTLESLLQRPRKTSYKCMSQEKNNKNKTKKQEHSVLYKNLLHVLLQNLEIRTKLGRKEE